MHVSISKHLARGGNTHIVTSEDSQVEGQQLQRDDAQDALQAVHTVRHFDGAARVFDGLVVIFVTNHNGTALWIKRGSNVTQISVTKSLKTHPPPQLTFASLKATSVLRLLRALMSC